MTKVNSNKRAKEQTRTLAWQGKIVCVCVCVCVSVSEGVCEDLCVCVCVCVSVGEGGCNLSLHQSFAVTSGHHANIVLTHCLDFHTIIHC